MMCRSSFRFSLLFSDWMSDVVDVVEDLRDIRVGIDDVAKLDE